VGIPMGEPVRIQRKRTKGWRMPPNTVFVGRPTQWGNPAVVGEPHPMCNQAEIDSGHECAKPLTAAEAVEVFRALPFTDDDLAPLRGKNLACFCALDQPCHADVLLELANRPAIRALELSGQREAGGGEKVGGGGDN
jgi:hypothetical protein